MPSISSVKWPWNSSFMLAPSWDGVFYLSIYIFIHPSIHLRKSGLTKETTKKPFKTCLCHIYVNLKFVFAFQKKGRCFEKAFFGLWLRWRMGWKRINTNGWYKCSKEGVEWDGASKLSPSFLGLLLGGWTDVLVAPNEERMTPDFPNGWSLVLGPPNWWPAPTYYWPLYLGSAPLLI